MLLAMAVSRSIGSPATVTTGGSPAGDGEYVGRLLGEREL